MSLYYLKKNICSFPLSTPIFINQFLVIPKACMVPSVALAPMLSCEDVFE